MSRPRKTSRERKRSASNARTTPPDKPDAQTKTIDFPRVRPEPPKHLDANAKALFNRIADDLHKSGVARKWDGASLGEYCQAVSDVERLTMRMRKEGGEVLTGPNGGSIYNPTYVLLKDARVRVKQFGAMFGLAPLHRTRVRLPGSDIPATGEGEEPKDNMAEFDQAAR